MREQEGIRGERKGCCKGVRVETLKRRGGWWWVGSDQGLGRWVEGGLLGQNSPRRHAHTFPGAVTLEELALSQERPWREQSRQWAILSGQGLAQKKLPFSLPFFFFLSFFFKGGGGGQGGGGKLVPGVPSFGLLQGFSPVRRGEGQAQG